MPIRTPPVGEHAVGENDHVAGLLLTVDDDMTEAVALDPWRRLTPDHRFVLSILAQVVRSTRPGAVSPPAGLSPVSDVHDVARDEMEPEETGIELLLSEPEIVAWLELTESENDDDNPAEGR